MSDAEVTITLRDECKSMTQEEFVKAYTKAQLELKASEAGVAEDKLSAAKTKADIVALIYGQYPLPDPALRGTSEVENPVAKVWASAENAFAAFRTSEDGEKPRRKDVVAACEANGIAHYTARTQYQAWFRHTDKGTIAITPSDEGLPKGLGALLGFPAPQPVEEEVVAEKK